MPLYEYLCLDCGGQSEILVTGTSEEPKCKGCQSSNLKKLLSAHATLSSTSGDHLPGPGDTACCGAEPGQAMGCAGPGSCCGKV